MPDEVYTDHDGSQIPAEAVGKRVKAYLGSQEWPVIFPADLLRWESSPLGAMPAVSRYLILDDTY